MKRMNRSHSPGVFISWRTNNPTGFPSTKRAEALAVDAPKLGWLQGAATAIAAPAALGGLVLAAGVLTHHLQVHVFVI